MIKKRGGWICLSITCLLLSACGFALRQPHNFAPLLQTIYISTTLPATPNDSFVQELERSLIANNVRVVNSPGQATAILNILSDETSNTMVAAGAVNASGFYTAYLTVQFAVEDKAGHYLIQPSTIQRNQPFSSNATQVLSANLTASQLAAEMEHSIAEELINQLTKISSSQS